jgi:hypothetical protein
MDSISTYWPFLQPVSLWSPKPPQNEKKATKLKNIIFKTRQPLSGGLSRHKI